MTDDEVLQLAMYTAAIDAKRFGAEYQPGVFRPTWEDRGPAGQEAYIADARTQFEAVETIQTVRRKNTTPDLDATLKALGESRARYGDMEARLVAAEAVITAALFQVSGDPCLYPRELITETLRRHQPTVLADHDKEVAARALETAAATIPEQMRIDELGLHQMDYTDQLPQPSLAMLNGGTRFAERLVERATSFRSGSEGDTR